MTADRLEDLQCIFWDMYKDAYGVRPRGIDTTNWTEDDFEAEFDSLAFTIDREEAARKESEAAAVVRFEAQIQSTVAAGAGSREDAIRWMHDAEGTNGDADFLCYCLGLPYGYLK